jgi:hypothetical protein
MCMRGVTRVVVFGFLVFTTVFDLLIIGAILHGTNNAPFISQSPTQTQPAQPTIEYVPSDFILPSDLVEQPYINSN